MSYVVTEACIRCKFMECVEVCPVQAFRAGQNFVVIDPSVCVNCAICELVCPAGAIRAKETLAGKDRDYIDINIQFAKTWPLITQQGKVPDDAQTWLTVTDKREFLLPAPDPEAQ
ncbi:MULTISPECIES: 4Fe-4S binding protein [unclassified Herbaspirillum]|uniref:4Fe-4S binding protein n=1 Tax=unclassified Herbaspirillum TaxID=2624150 RepID=UPI00383A15EF